MTPLAYADPVALNHEPIRIPPTPALRRWSDQNGFSPELVARWGEFYSDLPALLESMAKQPASCLRFNGLRGDPAETKRKLVAKGFVLDDGPFPQSVIVREAPFSPGATPEYLAGRYFMQDVSSMLAPLALEPRPGETVADLSAAPGGKTVAMADLMHDQGRILAYEIDPDRHRTLTSNLARCGVSMCASFAQPGQKAVELGMEFDAVLLDAPCTGEGVVSKDPRRRMGQLQEYSKCSREQESLLKAAAAIVRPGGRIVYATCTLAPEENELQIANAVENLGLIIEDLPPIVRDARINGQPLHPGLTRLANLELPKELAKTAHALPHVHACLGFFVARLRKEGS